MLKISVRSTTEANLYFRKNNYRIRDIFVYRAQILNKCKEPSVSAFSRPTFTEMFYPKQFEVLELYLIIHP
jgi:hypothetical protein